MHTVRYVYIEKGCPFEMGRTEAQYTLSLARMDNLFTLAARNSQSVDRADRLVFGRCHLPGVEAALTTRASSPGATSPKTHGDLTN